MASIRSALENLPMPIQVGERLPQVTFRVMTSDGPVAKTTDDLFKGRKVVLVAVPGAFTPTCHRNHLPGYVQKKDEILAKGVDAILVTSVNDVFVLEAWGKASEAEGIEFLSDGNADFAKAIGLSMDGAGFGLGTRSQRYSMVVEDGVVQALNVEDAPSKAQHSGADNILKDL
jgi:glutaredoxin/glutathione-dependent peroxiredoxin